MAIGVILEFKGATLDQYDQLIDRMGLQPRGPGAPGGIFHWVTATDDGLRITDVWETREHFEQFARDQIGPYAQEIGLPSPPQITFHEVHNYQTAAS
jgi:hypothetical protein